MVSEKRPPGKKAPRKIPPPPRKNAPRKMPPCGKAPWKKVPEVKSPPPTAFWTSTAPGCEL